MERVISVGDLNHLILESSKEFKAKLGAGVESGNKTINDKAYKDAKTRVKNFDGGGKEEYPGGTAKYQKVDNNRTTLGAEPEHASAEYKKRIKAQLSGYTSDKEASNGIEKSGDFTGNKTTGKEITRSESDYNKREKEFKRTGLQAREMPKGTFDKDELYESKNYPTAWFKKTTFLTEGHMESLVPDEMKKEGKIFNIKDKTGNQYLVEWRENHSVILSHNNENGMNESINRMKELMGYKSSDSKTDNDIRMNESKRFGKTLGILREITH